MKLAIRRNSASNFFSRYCTELTLCYNLFIWDTTFNYFLKSCWQSILTALCPRGEFPSCLSIKSARNPETSHWHTQKQKKYLRSNMTCMLYTHYSFPDVYTMFCWEKRVLFNLGISELQKKACCSTRSIMIMAPTQSNLWSKLQCQWSIADLHCILEERKKI